MGFECWAGFLESCFVWQRIATYIVFYEFTFCSVRGELSWLPGSLKERNEIKQEIPLVTEEWKHCFDICLSTTFEEIRDQCK